MARLKELFKKTSYITLSHKEYEVPFHPPEKEEKTDVPSVPEGLWIKCTKCGELLYKEDVVENAYVCPKCQGYFRTKVNTRIRMILDKNSFKEWDMGISNTNPLDYPDYDKKIKSLQSKTHLDEAVKVGIGKIDGQSVVIGICDTRFLMGSMGYVVGEKITRAVEKATEKRLPVVMFCCSGGARMQEGIVSLMQMAKTSAALGKHSDAGLLYISVLADPTTGGVTASFAMLGDVILAEPGALIGFAGPRVIQQTIGQKLPEGFQRSEFLVEHGIIDGIVERKDLKSTLSKLVDIHAVTSGYAKFSESGNQEYAVSDVANTDIADTEVPNITSYGMEPVKMEDTDSSAAKGESIEISAWERVKITRSAARPTSLDYIKLMFTDFIEMHGDRTFRDDGSIVGGVALLDGQPVTVIGTQKGKTTKENIIRNFGMPSPEGYRKAFRLMKQAEKFNRPVICFIDTPGAYCGIDAEERGQGTAIATNLLEMAGLKVPILSIVISEGGSGGALALAVGNEVWMMENATYSILSPEGFASILWKDSKMAQEAAGVMRITARDLEELNIIDKIIREDIPACEENLEHISKDMKHKIKEFLQKQDALTIEEIVNQRYERFRRM